MMGLTSCCHADLGGQHRLLAAELHNLLYLGNIFLLC